MKSTIQEPMIRGGGSNPANDLIVQSLARLDQAALGVSMGALFALLVFCATNFLIYRGGDDVGRNLALLSQYFTEYEISFAGSFIGAGYGFISGFVIGWTVAFLRNAFINIYLLVIKLRSSVAAVNDFIDNP